MREAHPIERRVGIVHYVSDAPGTGGRIRARPADFRVRELERFEVESLDVGPDSYPVVVVRATLEGWETNQFAGALSNHLGISRERVSWAGTKDKHAITTQLVSIRALDPDGVVALRDIGLDGVEIEVLGRAGRALQFGDLAGNAFEIVVRDAEAPENAAAITDELRAFGGDSDDDDEEVDPEPTTVGVPNYFGQQRFGSRRPITHEVGLAIVRENWREAVFAYVGRPHEREPEHTRDARAFVERELREGATREDWASALDRFPDYLGFERAMLHRLAEDGAERPADFREALEAVPSSLQRLFVNAAQSYLFNQIISVRLDRGIPFDRAVAGDAVCFADSDAPDDLRLPDTDRHQRVTEERVETINRHTARGRAFVTAPLVGTETTFGAGEPGEIEREVCAEAEIEPEMFDLPGEFHSTGTRRAILLRTDLTVEREPLSFAFSLPKGSYATVLLREYLKGDPDGFA